MGQQNKQQQLHWEGETPALSVGYCESCDEHMFPIRDFCPSCFSEDLSTRTVTEGRLETYSSIHIPKAGFPNPYTIGFVRVTDDDIRLFSYITDPTDECEVGQTVYVQAESFGEYEETWAFGQEETDV